METLSVPSLTTTVISVSPILFLFGEISKYGFFPPFFTIFKPPSGIKSVFDADAEISKCDFLVSRSPTNNSILSTDPSSFDTTSGISSMVGASLYISPSNLSHLKSPILLPSFQILSQKPKYPKLCLLPSGRGRFVNSSIFAVPPINFAVVLALEG